MNEISYRSALETVLKLCSVLSTEKSGLLSAQGRISGKDIFALRDDPSAPKSAMDGFALRSKDTAKAAPGRPARFSFGEVVGAGHLSHTSVGKGTGVRIMTGTMIPHGADAVVKQEDTQSHEEGTFELIRPMRAGENMISVGASLRAGQRLIESGKELTPQALGLLASQGITKVTVHSRPRVALLALGDELAEPGSPLLPGQLYVSNLYGIEGECRRHGASARNLGIARDDPALIGRMLRPCLGSEDGEGDPLACDLIITLGGSHHGDFDFASDVLENLGARLHFRRTRINMGGSTLFATHGNTLIFGLPGTPMAAWMAFEVLVRPALWRLGGRSETFRPMMRALLNEPLTLRPGRTYFLPATLEFPDGHPTVTPLTRGTPSALPPSLLANGLIHWPDGTEFLAAGSSVPVEWLG